MLKITQTAQHPPMRIRKVISVPASFCIVIEHPGCNNQLLVDVNFTGNKCYGGELVKSSCKQKMKEIMCRVLTLEKVDTHLKCKVVVKVPLC